MTAPNIADLLAEGGSLLAGPDGRAEAAVLLAGAVDRSRAWLLAHDDVVVDAGPARRYRDWLQRRRAGEPVAYLLGRREFWSLSLEVSPAVLIPRPDTECLVEQALARIPPERPLRIADLGTGSGAIALAIASERPLVQVVATDVDRGALMVARDNVARHGGTGRVRLRHGDWFEALAAEAPFDLILSNPPYIAAGDRHLRQGDLRHEPARALASGSDGLDAIRILVSGAGGHLVDGGWLLLEHGHDQARAVRVLMQGAGFSDVDGWRDFGGNERVTSGRLRRGTIP